MIDVVEYCLSKPKAVETYPFGNDVTVFKIGDGGKMFALCGATNRPDTINLKCDPVRARILRQDHPEITPGYHMNKEHWNRASLTGKLSDELVMELIDHSYDLVSGKK